MLISFGRRYIYLIFWFKKNMISKLLMNNWITRSWFEFMVLREPFLLGINAIVDLSRVTIIRTVFNIVKFLVKVVKTVTWKDTSSTHLYKSRLKIQKYMYSFIIKRTRNDVYLNFLILRFPKIWHCNKSSLITESFAPQ